MSDRTAIGWTDATWNPVTGCSRVSPGCEHCYAEALSLRRGWSQKPWTAQNAAENVVLHPERLVQPLGWRTPRRVFVNSMSDLFHERVPDEFIAEVWAVMMLSPWLTYQVLTKRAERMHAVLTGDGFDGLVGFAIAEHLTERTGPAFVTWPAPNVWLGVSVEDHRRADERIPLLLDTPASLRWISAEPLLGPVDLGQCGTLETGPALSDHHGGLDWVVVGGESGPGRRPMKLEWLTSIVDYCQAAAVPLFVKQDSGARPGKQGRIPDALWLHDFPRGA